VTPKKKKETPDEGVSKSQLKRRKHQEQAKEAEDQIKEYKRGPRPV
jgi:hypothetical protein